MLKLLKLYYTANPANPANPANHPQCPATLGRIQCAKCERANKPIPTDAGAAQSPGGIGRLHENRYQTPIPVDEIIQRTASASPSASSILSDDEGRGDVAETTTIVTSRDSCANCGKVEGELKKCTACKNTVYCSRECQKEDCEFMSMSMSMILILIMILTAPPRSVKLLSFELNLKL